MLFALSFILFILVLNGGGVEVKEEIYLATCDFPHLLFCWNGLSSFVFCCFLITTTIAASPLLPFTISFHTPLSTQRNFQNHVHLHTLTLHTKFWGSNKNVDGVHGGMVKERRWGDYMLVRNNQFTNLSNDRRSTRSQHFIHPDPPLYLDTNPARGQCCNPHWCQGMLISTLKGVNYTPQLVIN